MSKTAYSVPYTALAKEAREIKKELLAAVESVLDGGRYILGPEVTAFEREFAGYCQVKFATGVGNGTSSLHLVLRSLGVGEGDEVITAPNSFLASASTRNSRGRGRAVGGEWGSHSGRGLPLHFRSGTVSDRLVSPPG